MKVLKLKLVGTRNRILFCETTIWEFEEIRAIQGVNMEMDLTWGDRVEQEKLSLV